MCASCMQPGYAQQSGGGNYPTGNGVRVKEVDGSPNVPGTQTLVFPNGSLTRAGQTVTVTIAGGTTINSTNGQVPYRVNSTTFGDSGIAYSSGMIGIQTTPSAAQLEINSQSTTRPSLKLRALTATPGTQNVFESYNAANANTFGLTSDGAVTMGDGAALSNTPLAFNVGRGVNNPYVLGYRVSSIDHLLLGATNSSSTGITSAGIVMLSDKSVSWQANSTWSASATDLSLYRDAANTLAQRNGTNAQTFRVYETYTDGSNYERLEINASATTNTIKPAAAGTGTASKIDYYLTPTVFMSSGTGSPEGVLTAGIGSTYHRTDGGAGTSFYVKESGTGNTGWVAK